MADFSSLKQTIQSYIKQNGNEEITGNILQDVLLAMVTTMGDSAINGLASALQDEITARQNQDGTLQTNINGVVASINAINTKLAEGYVYSGIATPSTNPSEPTGKVFYIATTAGTYTNFGGLAVAQGINILKFNGTAWSQEQVLGIDDEPTADSPNLVKSGGVQKELALGAVYDVSAKNPTAGPNNDGKWESLSALLSDANLNTLIPTAYRKGGMSIKFVQSSDNKYVQYRLKATSWSTIVTDWQEIDESSIDIAQNTADISELTLLTPSSTIDNKWVSSNGELRENTNFEIRKYQVEAGKLYTFSGAYSSEISSSVYFIHWFDENENWLGHAEYHRDSESYVICIDKAVVVPENAAYAYLNVNKVEEQTYTFNLKSVGNAIKSRDLQQQITQNTSDIAQNTADVAQNTADISESIPITPYEIDGNYRVRGNVGENAYIDSFSGITARKYNVSANRIYIFSGISPIGYTAYSLFWIDSNGKILRQDLRGISGQEDIWEDVAVTAPDGAVEVWMNVISDNSQSYKLFGVIDTIKSRDLLEAISETISTTLTPYESDDGYRSRPNSTTGLAELVSFQYGTVRKYNVVGGNNYTFSGKYDSAVNLYVFIWVDANGIATNGEYKGTNREDIWEDVAITAPEGATELWMNVFDIYADKFNLKSNESEIIDFVALKQQVQQNTEDIVKLNEKVNNLNNKLMKVVITGNEAAEDTPFYVRSRYNDEKDILITHRINQNLLITFRYTYIGANTLTDEQLMTTTYLVSSHTDSTSPLRDYTQYWHLFAQHGYPVPYFANSIGMTSEDVGALWKDQLDREYHIGKVTAEYVWLLPVIYQDANGHYTRDWNSKNTSTDITSLTNVSGGSYTSPITLSTYSQEQLRPIMKVENRTYVIDGVEVSDVGTYYCNDFEANETEVGYDPATILDWFGGEDGKPELIGAQKHVVFTYSYNYKGAQCAVYTTMHCLREAKGYYGGTQQQFFFDKGDYKAMFMIPKAAARNGVELDKPFNSPSSASTGYQINRTAAHLKDVDDQVDRQIGMLHNPNDNTYLVGMAAGLSLVVGDTVKTKRNQTCQVNSLLLDFSPSNTNKFYVSGINTSAFESGYYPAGYFKEVDYYVSYFDPAGNVGQVYWYKDGSRYIIYAHCQSMQNVLAINVPEFMDGLNLSVVEKTADTDLLSDTIQNGKFFVNYNTNDANYIVLIAR